MILLFDFYAALLPSIWAKVSRTPVVYYIQDIGVDVAKTLTTERAAGGVMLNLFRVPYERLLLKNSELVVAVSDDMHSKLIASHGVPAQRLRVCGFRREIPVPNIPLIESWRIRLGLRSDIGVVFVGGLQYPPNRLAAEFIVHQLAPEMLRRGSAAKFILAGAGTDSFAKRVAPNIIGLGPVDDLSNLLFACHVGLAPISSGGGISGKVADYLLHGLQVIATPIAAVGIPRQSSTYCVGHRAF